MYHTKEQETWGRVIMTPAEPDTVVPYLRNLEDIATGVPRFSSMIFSQGTLPEGTRHKK